MRAPVRIAPSILAADFAHLGDDIRSVSKVADLLHVDVMDGHFVPNISLGPPVIASLAKITDLYLDCHLMISDPLRYLQPLADAGANGVTAHIEAIPDPEPFFTTAGDLGLDASLAINPDTPIEAIVPFLDECAMVLVMSVHPGFGGQQFIEGALPRIARLREMIDSRALATDIQVDGGIDTSTAGRARRAGVDVVVAGTAVFRADDPAAAVREMRLLLDDNGAT